MNSDVTAVVVTYNRLKYLKKVIQSLKSQDHPLAEIIVVNNGSTDGTYEWLKDQTGIRVIHQGNVGGAGGFHSGMKYAYSMDCSWIWIMDDDVRPENDCLGILLKGDDENTIRSPLRFSSNGMPYKNDTLKYNFTNPFSGLWDSIVDDRYFKKDYFECEGPTFEGALFHRNIITKIGLPEKKFFIFADDTEYFIRAKRAGAKIIVNTQSRMHRMIDPPEPSNMFTWKHYYIIRNTLILDLLYGNLPVKVLRPFEYLIKWLTRAKNSEDRKTVLRAFKDAYKFKMSKDALSAKENSER